MVVIGKADLGEQRRAGPSDALVISSVTGEGIPALLHRIADLVDQEERFTPDRRGFILHRPVSAPFRIARSGRGWKVEGSEAIRAVRFADLTHPQAAELAARRLARLGVDRALASAGAAPGDTVTIGDLEFEWVPETPPEGWDDDWEEE